MNKSVFKWLFSAVFGLIAFSAVGQPVTPTSSTTTGCEDEPIQFFANAPGATSYSWNFGDGKSSLNQNPVYNYSDAGNYTVILSVTRGTVTTSGSIIITIKPTPKFTVDLEPQVEQCFKGNKFCFRINTSNNICSGKIVFSDGVLLNTGAFTGSYDFCKSFTINANQRTPYDMEIELTDCNGCTKLTKFPKVADVFPRLGLNFWSNQPKGCDSVRATYVNLSSVPRSDVQRFIWFFGDGQADSTRWGVAPDTLIHKYYATGPNDGNFTARLFVETKSGCKDTFDYDAAATNFLFCPRIVADRDSACADDSELNFLVEDAPPQNSITGGWLWNFGDNLMDPVCSGCNYNITDFPDASRRFGKLGPFQVSLTMNHIYCGAIVVYDTVQIIGPQTTMEAPPMGILIAQNHRYQCIIQDTVQFTNLSTFYHNDNNWIDDDSAYVWSRTDTFAMIFNAANEREYGFLKGDTALEIFTKSGNVYTFQSVREVPLKCGIPQFADGQLVHHFQPSQEAYTDGLKENHCVVRMWDFADPYAPKCTTDTRAGLNIGKNCAFSMDSLPKHWYTPWDTVLAYWQNVPLTYGVFNETTTACTRRSVHFSDSIAIIDYISPFIREDELVTSPTASTSYVKNILVPKSNPLTRDTIPFPFYNPALHTLISSGPNPRINAGDTVDPVLYRRLFYNTTVRCFSVELKHSDTCHPLRCESIGNASLALGPPRAKGVRWSGIRCLAPPSPPYGIVFNVQNTKPGCSQDDLQFNFDSASGRNNWVPMIGGLFPGSAPPPPPFPVMPYVPTGTFPTSFVYLYTANNITDRKTGWVTVGTIVGNGLTTTQVCRDTMFFNRLLKFRFANASFTIERPIPRAQSDKAVCRYERIYFKMVDELQPDVEIFSWAWGDGDRFIETKKSYDTTKAIKKYFLDRATNIEKYIFDNKDMGGRLSPYAAYLDSVDQGWTTSRVFSARDSLYFHLKLAYNKDSIAKWLADSNALIGWIVIERQINDRAVQQQNAGQLPYSFTRQTYDTFLTSIVLDYNVNTIIAPEITPVIIRIFEQLGFDYYDIPSTQINKFFGPPGSGKCIDTTGYSNFITFEFEETGPAGIRRLSSRDTNIVQNWYHAYPVSGIHAPVAITRTRIDGCVQIRSLPIKVGFAKEVIFSDTVLCQGKELKALANYWYWSTADPRIQCDPTDYWRDQARLIIPKEKVTVWDWDLGDGIEFVRSNQIYSGLGLGFNPTPFNRNRPSGPGPALRINKNLTSGKVLGSSVGPGAIYYNTPGVFNLAILATDSNGCDDTTKQKIYVSELVSKFGFDNQRPQCKTILELLDSSFIIDGCRIAGLSGCDSIITWWVDWGDGSPRAGKNNDNRTDRLGHVYTRNGKFVIRLIVESLLGCIDTLEKELIITGPIPNFEPELLRICQLYDTAVFINKSDNPTQAAQWIIDFGDGFTQSTKSRNDTFRHVYRQPGDYNVFLTQFDSIANEGKFCSAIYPDTTYGQQELITITVIKLDSTQLFADDTTVCIGQLISFANISKAPTDTTWVGYNWIFDIDNVGGDTTNTSDSTELYAYRKAGVFRMTVVPSYISTLLKPYCPYRDTITIYVDTVNADFTYDTAQTPKVCFTNTSFNAITYRWWFDTYKDSTSARQIVNPTEQSTEVNPCFTYDSTGCYFVVLEATSPDGCKDTTVQEVCNFFQFKIKGFNTFTPGNGDGLNDVFDIPIEGHDLYQVYIYNRYGTRVFESEDANVDWNGKIFNTGADAADGTYYYKVKYKSKRDDEEKELFGAILLIRK